MNKRVSCTQEGACHLATSVSCATAKLIAKVSKQNASSQPLISLLQVLARLAPKAMGVYINSSQPLTINYWYHCTDAPLRRIEYAKSGQWKHDVIREIIAARNMARNFKILESIQVRAGHGRPRWRGGASGIRLAVTPARIKIANFWRQIWSRLPKLLIINVR